MQNFCIFIFLRSGLVFCRHAIGAYRLKTYRFFVQYP